MTTRNKVPKFTKANVLKMINGDIKKRLKYLNTFDKPEYPDDIQPQLAEKMWHLMHNGNITGYCLFKEMNCYNSCIEHWENMQSFLGNLMDDAYFGIEYKPDLGQANSEIEMQKRMNTWYKKQGKPVKEPKPLIHLSSFNMVWCGYEHPAIVYEKEMFGFLDWFVYYSDNEFVYKGKPGTDNYCKIGPTHHLGLINDNWDDYPKQIKQAYDAWLVKSK